MYHDWRSTSRQMRQRTQIAHRFGSAMLAVLLPPVVWLVELPIERSLGVDLWMTRAATSIVCITLLIHSWLVQRTYSRSKAELGFATCLITLPLLGATWLGLNVMRSHLYPSNWTESEVARWDRVCQAQHWVEIAAATTAGVAIVWSCAMLVFRIIEHFSQREPSSLR